MTDLGLKQIVSQYSTILSPIAVDSVLRLVTPASTNVDLRDVRIVKKVGGTIDDTELMDGVLLHQNAITQAGGPTRMEKAKIGIIQFQLSPPKPDVRAVVWEPSLVHGLISPTNSRRWTTRLL